MPPSPTSCQPVASLPGVRGGALCPASQRWPRFPVAQEPEPSMNARFRWCSPQPRCLAVCSGTVPVRVKGADEWPRGRPSAPPAGPSRGPGVPAQLPMWTRHLGQPVIYELKNTITVSPFGRRGHLPAGQFHQHPRVPRCHQHQHPVQPAQPSTVLQALFPPEPLVRPAFSQIWLGDSCAGALLR